MKKHSWREMVFGETNGAFRRSLISYTAVLMLISGVILILRGVAGEGSIDIQMAIVQGKLQSGSIGILFSFMALIQLIVCYVERGASKLELKRSPDGKLEITHKGVFTDRKARSIRILIGEEVPENTEDNKNMEIDEE